VVSPVQTSTAQRWSARFVRYYNLAVTAVAGAAMGTIVIVMFVQVLFRYALNDSLIWAEEVSRYLLILMTFLLIGAAFERGEMVSVQFLVNALPRRLAHLVMVPVYLAMIVFLLIISYYGYRFATFNARFFMPAIDFILTSVLRRPVSGAMSMYWVYMLIPVGCGILSVHFLVAMLRVARVAIRGDGAA
jgi:TRAP-type C4-dicarboxylate transport system permease small subunit